MSAEPVVTTVYSMPYAPDDYFYYEKSIRKLYRSGARRAAEKFGQTEAALDVGHAYGQNIVTGFNETPTLDLSPVYVRLAGIEGAFLLDAASYAWGPEGMVVSSDLMLVGVTGYDGLVPPPTSWLRLPVAPASIAPAGVTTIEASPAKANSIAIPEGFNARNPGPVLAALPTDGVDVFREWRDETVVVPPALVLDQFSVAAGPVITLQEFDYPLTLPADVIDLATGPVAEGFAGAVVPAVVVAVAAAAPGISIGVRVLTPAATIGLNALPPLVVGGASVAVPAAGVAVAGVVPDLVGRQRTQVLVAVAGVSVAALAPAVASGASVAVPVAGVTVAGVVPVIQPAILDPSFSSVSLLLHMNGTDNSTTFTDNSSLGLSVSVFGNARISTAQSKFSGASGLFDGNGDYLLATSSGFSFGTGDFTVEGWMYNVDGSGYRAIASFNLGNDNNSLYINSSTLVWYDGANRATSASFSSSTWHHFAATRASGVIRVFLNGVKSSSDYTASANITSGSVRIGTRGSANGEWFNGYLDDLRITKGVARYTANFTPPTAPFPDA